MNLSQRDMQLLTKKYPLPCGQMYGIPNSDIKTRQEMFRKYDSPAAFLDLSDDEQRRLIRFVCQLGSIHNYNPKHNSYTMKHLYRAFSYGSYVYNGAFKGAMLLRGFKVKDEHELNWTFNMSERVYTTLRHTLAKERAG